MKNFNNGKLLIGIVILLNGFGSILSDSDTNVRTEALFNNSGPTLEVIAEDNINNCTQIASESNSSNREFGKNANCIPKSRRKRYVAFPEGSSFSVI